MIKIHSRLISYIVTLFTTVFLGLFLIAGCQEQTNTGSELISPANNSEQNFQSPEDRPPTSKTLIATADILAAQGRDKECEFVLKRIITEYPRFLPAYNSMAELKMRHGQINAAIEIINDALRINPDDTVLLNNLGVCRLVTGDYEKAFAVFTKAACSKPENARYRMNMAVALGLMGRYSESLSLFRQILPEKQATFNLNMLKEHKKEVSDISFIQESKSINL